MISIALFDIDLSIDIFEILPIDAKDLIKTGVNGVAYETVTSDDGSLPLLAPMSKIAGRISLVVG